MSQLKRTHPRRQRRGLLLLGCLFTSACVSAPSKAVPQAVPASEHQQTLAALKPRRARPLIVVLGDNAGTETTDFLVPYAVLRQADVADVEALATHPGPLELHPALTILPESTTRAFEARHPEGADYVIVPALHHADAPDVLAFVRGQAARGAIIVGICDGALVLGHAGLLDGRAATAFWYSADELSHRYPSMHLVRDRRYVVDRGVMTTTGVTASVPASLVLVEAIAGAERARALARELGVEDFGAAHDSDAFQLRGHVWTAAWNMLAFWKHETLGIPVRAGVDEISLALAADAYSRTYRSKAVTIAAMPGPVITRRGLQLVPDRVHGDSSVATTLVVPSDIEPARSLDGALRDIRRRYGQRSAAFVALQLEYPWPAL